MSKRFKNIPTNIISGFLGAGKTTAIQYLLTKKNPSEKWAVIVNEFGQIGIDGELLKSEGVEIKQIPGGCLCCVGSQSLNVGLNQLIRTIKPQRIIIEPTGLGHPAKLIAALTGEFYQSVLDVKAVINLLDARNLTNEKYTRNESFIDQSNLADVLVASKLDQYSETDKNAFYDYASSFHPEKIKVAMVEQGRLQLNWLDLKRNEDRTVQFPNSHSHSHHLNENSETLQEHNQHDGWLLIEGHANGFTSIGWKVSSQRVFNKEKTLSFVHALFSDSNVERVKGIVKTEQGGLSINFSRHERNHELLESLTHSALEVISSSVLNVDTLDKEFRYCSSGVI